jgi:hypothetical protein
MGLLEMSIWPNVPLMIVVDAKPAPGVAQAVPVFIALSAANTIAALNNTRHVNFLATSISFLKRSLS